MTTTVSFGTRLGNIWRERRSSVILAVLLLAIIVVYGLMFMRSRASSVRADAMSPQITKILLAQKGQIPRFPMFGGPGRHFNWKKMHAMTPAQRHAFFMKRRIKMEAFFLAFAHATPAQRQAIIDATKARFAMMHKRRPGGHHGPGGRGGFASRMPQMMANGLIRGNPQMHAAMTQFFMGLHGAPTAR